MAGSTRRRLLLGSIAAGAAAVVAWVQKNSILRWLVLRNDNRGATITSAPTFDEDICVLTSEQVEGPFFVAAPDRSDVREDRKGQRLDLRLQVLRMPECTPIENAIVEIWHCDAEGNYSGYPEEMGHDMWRTLTFVGLTGLRGGHIDPVNEARYLRGAQVTDRDGCVDFLTIFPGWYEPRAPHIHVKIIAGGEGREDYLTTQLYFPPELCREVYLGQEPYRTFGDSPYNLANDVAFKESPEGRGLVLGPRLGERGNLVAEARIGIEAVTG